MSIRCIFRVVPNDGYEVVYTSSPEGTDYFHANLDSTPRAPLWNPPPVQICTDDDNRTRYKPFDVTVGVGGALTLTRKTVDQMGGFLRDYGEVLPLVCDDAELYVFNPLILVDALDLGACEFGRIKETGRIYSIKKYVFRPELLKDTIDIFQVPQLRVGTPLFSERAVATWQKSGARGIGFKQIWPE